MGVAVNWDMHLNLFVSFASFHLAVKCLLTPLRVFRGQLSFLGLPKIIEKRIGCTGCVSG